MINTTTDIAKQLYHVWASRMDIVDPQQQTMEVFNYLSDTKEVGIDRDRARPKWHALTFAQQEVWLKVAESALEVLEPKPVLRLYYDDLHDRP